MAERRALVFKAGTVGLICAAYEVAIERGIEGREGSIRLVRECTELATVMVDGTRFCAVCAELVVGQGRTDVALVRGLAVSPNAGIDHCYAVELVLDVQDDYAEALDAKVIAVCDRPAVFVWLGSGLCAVHRGQLRHQRGWSLN